MTVRRRTRLPLETLAPRLLEPAAESGFLAWPTVFGNDRPVEVEVGFGKGLFLRTAARSRPDRNFLGIEIIRKYQLETATRLIEDGLANVRVAKADAREFFAAHLAPGSVAAVHVYFPDPWWKKRHHKRRLFTDAFASACERVLTPSGRLYVATDVEDYFTVITGLVATQTGLRPEPPPPPSEPAHDLDYLTHFERKFRKEGRPIYRAVYLRPALTSPPPG